MKKTFLWILSLAVLLCACAQADPAGQSAGSADAAAAEAFSDVWVSGDMTCEIWYEEGSFWCYVFRYVSEDEGIIWEYATCLFDPASGTLECSEGTMVHDVFDTEKMELRTEDVGTSLTCSFSLAEDGALVWSPEGAETVRFSRPDPSQIPADGAAADGSAFEGAWVSGNTALDIAFEDGVYRCRISREESYAHLTEWDYTCEYDEETGLLRGAGSKYAVQYGDDGEEVSRTALWEGGEAVFALDGFASLTWDDLSEGAGQGMQFTPLDAWEGLDSFDPVWFYEGVWVCGEAQVSIVPQDGSALCTVVLPGEDGGMTVWEYTCRYDDAASCLVNDGTGTKTVSASSASGGTPSQGFAASFTINDDLLLVWDDKNEGMGSGLAFEYLIPTAQAPTPEDFADGFFRPAAAAQVGAAGASLRIASALAGACSFAIEHELWNPDEEAVRDSMSAAWESLDQEERGLFLEAFPSLVSLMKAAGEDWDAHRGLFDDAGCLAVMEEALFDPLDLLAWQNLADIAQSVTGAR